MRGLVLVAMLAAVFSGAGCGAGEPAATGPSAAAPSSLTPASPAAATTAAAVCGLLTLQQVSGLFGAQAKAEPSRNPGRDCMWTGSGGGMHQLHVQVYQGKSHYSAKAWGASPEPLEGLADEAFLIRKAGLGATVGFRDGETAVFVNYQILLTRDANPGAKADQLIALAKAIQTQR